MGMDWSPLRSVNLSSLCATTKLLQARLMGIDMVSVERKLAMTSAPDIGADDLRYRRHCNDAIQRFSRAHPSENDPWTPILYVFELYRGERKKTANMGHMFVQAPLRDADPRRVWTDPTLTRFLLVFCWPDVSCGHMSAIYADALRAHGQRFLNLVTYLRESETELNPEWSIFVRNDADPSGSASPTSRPADPTGIRDSSPTRRNRSRKPQRRSFI